jgi:hypothetical protein
MSALSEHLQPNSSLNRICSFRIRLSLTRRRVLPFMYKAHLGGARWLLCTQRVFAISERD